LVRPYFNGVTVATGDAGALADALHWIHEHHDRLPEMGQHAQQMAAAYSAQAWAQRWVSLARDLAEQRPA
jgi:glycosyltransferase involved in cell wall biosynthesis